LAPYPEDGHGACSRAAGAGGGSRRRAEAARMGDRQGRGAPGGLMAGGRAAALAPPGDGRERGAVTGPDIGRYVEVRQFAQEHDPGLATILRSPDVEAERARLKPALDAVGMPFDRFAEIHRVVLAD